MFSRELENNTSAFHKGDSSRGLSTTVERGDAEVGKIKFKSTDLQHLEQVSGYINLSLVWFGLDWFGCVGPGFLWLKGA